MRVCVLFLAVLPGCSLALLGGAESTCERWYAAMAQHDAKCHKHWGITAPECSDVDITSGGNIDDCERDMSNLQCDDTRYPDSCRINWTDVPVL